MANIIPKKAKLLKDQYQQSLSTLERLADHVENEEVIQEIESLKKSINEPFLFVVVGEVKAGKSSFINALLEAQEPICAVAPTPMTDKINQILFDEEERQVEINDHYRKIYFNREILSEISIVDTPGTNTIIQNHQEITERFVPIADLIVFVLESKNPYRQSIWDFFDLLNEEWKKKIVFVLQQKDIMSKEDLAINVNGVRDYLSERNIQDPTIFALSAKEELEGKTESGFQEFRDWLAENITGGKSYFLKIASLVSSTDIVKTSIDQGVTLREEQLAADQAFRQEIIDKIQNEENQISQEVQLLAENLSYAFNDTCQEFEGEIKKTLSFWGLLRRSVASIFTKQENLNEWTKSFQTRLQEALNERLKAKVDGGINNISKRIVNLSDWIDLKIRSGDNILTHDHELFSHIARYRTQLIEEIEERFEQLTQNENVALRPLNQKLSSSLPNQVATGSGIAVVGVVLAAVTKIMIFDVTGGILTGLGLLFAGISSGLNRSKILNNYKKTTRQGAEELQSQVENTLTDYAQELGKEMDNTFQKLDVHIAKERETIDEMKGTLSQLSQQLESLKSKL